MSALHNLHTHSNYCDAPFSIKEMVDSAITKGFTTLGISSHSPVPFASSWNMSPQKIHDYANEIRHLNKTTPLIDLYLGLEVDFIPTQSTPIDQIVQSIKPDYLIGSIHYLGFGTNNNWLTIDDSSDNFAQLIELDYQNSLQKACEDYWQRIGILASQFHPTILGHLDLIKMNGRKLNPQLESEKWYQEAVFKCLTIIEETNVVVEINTGGLSRGRVPDLYPSDWIITELVKRQIPIQINSDAHHPDQLDSYFVETRQHLQKLGIKTLRQIDNSIWKDVPIDF